MSDFAEWIGFKRCSNCGHPGFSHDAWADCSECEQCEGWEPDEDIRPFDEELD